MSADGGAKKIFISHASDDPDWPETAVRALAVKLRQRGVNVLLDYWHEQDVIGHKRGCPKFCVRS
jgi:predicted esterase